MMAALERREHLVLGAVTGDLTDAERQELDVLLAADPSTAVEIEQMRAVLEGVDGLDQWVEAQPSPSLEASIAAIDDTQLDATAHRDSGVAAVSSIEPRDGRRPAGRRTADRRSSRSSSARWRGVAAAAALVVVGAGGALGIERIVDHSSIVSGAPGTLGATEDVDFASEGVGEVDGSVMAHTWGTEAMLTIDGLEPGQTYDVLFVDERGSTIDAGSFLGSDVEINCTMNAAIMREDVASLRIVADDGSTIRAADLPPVTS